MRQSTKKIRIVTPARLHCTLINLSGLHNRIDSGIGFAISKPNWDMEIEFSEELNFKGLQLEKELYDLGAIIANNYIEKYQLGGFIITINEIIPLHAGLGGKTSFILSLGKLISTLYKIDFDVEKFAYQYFRGSTSGIGLNTFSGGGFVCDIGHKFPSEKDCFLPSSNSKAPPAKKLFSINVNKMKVLHFRLVDKGIFGNDEKALFESNCPLSHQSTYNVLASSFFQVAAGILTNDDESLQAGLIQIQNSGFKKIEWDIQPQIMKEFRDLWYKMNPKQALCLSSVGPTLYVIGNSFEVATSVLNNTVAKIYDKTECEFNNVGFKIY